MSRPRIMFVLPSLNGGGAERAAVTVINALDPDRFDLQLCLFRREGAYLDEVAPHVTVRQVGDGSRLRRMSALTRLFEESSPAIVMAFLSYASVFASARWADRRIRFVINQQTPVTAFLDDGDYRWREPVRRLLFQRTVRAVYPRADLIIATSRGVRDDLVSQFHVDADRIALVHNPVDLQGLARRAAEPIEDHLAAPGDRIIVAAGRLAEVKNFPLLLEAVGLIVKRLPVRLWILGQGSEEAALRRLAAEQGLGDRVAFLGFQSNPWRYIARADVFALTSKYEGFGNVLIEAMACGVPVVATASSGTREIIENGANGLLVERHEATDVAAALCTVLEDRTRASALALEARARVQRYDVPAVAARYHSLFNGLIAA